MRFEKNLILIFTLILVVAFASASPIPFSKHQNLQFRDSNGNVLTGTFAIQVNITSSADCTGVLFSNTTTVTTDSSGVISYDLPNVKLDYNQALYWCVYKDGVSRTNLTVSPVPQAEFARNTSWEGVIGRPGFLSNFTDDINATSTFNSTYNQFAYNQTILNETARITQMVNADCSGGRFQIGNQINGTVMCSIIPNNIISLDINNITNFLFNYNQTTPAQQYVESRFLNLSGSNANQNLNIGSFNLTADWFKGKFNLAFVSAYLTFNGTTVTVDDSKLGTDFNDTIKINSINTTANVQALGFTPGAHTIDTNETARVTNLVNTDCVVGQFTHGVQDNGTIICSTPTSTWSEGWNATFVPSSAINSSHAINQSTYGFSLPSGFTVDLPGIGNNSIFGVVQSLASGFAGIRFLRPASLTGRMIVGNSTDTFLSIGAFGNTEVGDLTINPRDVTKNVSIEWGNQDFFLSNDIFLRLEPTDTPPTCNVAREGALYQDLSIHNVCVCNSTNWYNPNGGGIC